MSFSTSPALVLGIGVALLLASRPAPADEAEPPEPGVAEEATVPALAPASESAPAPVGAPGPEGEQAADPASSDEEAPPPGVTRAVFTTQVVNREPIGEIESLGGAARQIMFWSELQGLTGQTVVHRWELEGRTMAEVPFLVGGPRWRVHSTKRLQPGWGGVWTVSVLDGSGAVLHQESFSFLSDAPSASEAEAVPGAPSP